MTSRQLQHGNAAASGVERNVQQLGGRGRSQRGVWAQGLTCWISSVPTHMWPPEGRAQRGRGRSVHPALPRLLWALTRTGVLVAGDGADLQHPLGPAAIRALAAQVHEDEMVVGATCRTDTAQRGEGEPWLGRGGNWALELGGDWGLSSARRHALKASAPSTSSLWWM